LPQNPGVLSAAMNVPSAPPDDCQPYRAIVSPALQKTRSAQPVHVAVDPDAGVIVYVDAAVPLR
jgi:hypothetical protein